ncbi:hypothetical protein ACFSCZ_19455 [Siminovitchia sediminis]|uniref:Uncharacterized protein n=1 Tax=Siminovitchia sediminis TaxID=1274353 RepID=A0ABW4KPV5_9BACI
MKMDVAKFNAILLEDKLELTMMLMSLKDGDNNESRMIRLLKSFLVSNKHCRNLER